MTVSGDGAALAPLLSGARELYVSGFAAEIATMPELLEAHAPAGLGVTGLFSPLVNQRSYANAARGIRVRTFLLTRPLKADLALGLVDYCPWRYGMIDRWLSTPGRFDTAIVMVSPPDADGMCSLGVQADFAPAFLRRTPRTIAFVNPHMPQAGGDALIDPRIFTAMIDHDAPILEMLNKPADDTSDQIARTIVGLVPDGATIQLGTGQIPSRVLANLTSHRALKVHSGVVDDNILLLEDSGVLDRDTAIRTGTAVGTRALYDRLGDRARFDMRAVAYTHAHRNIAGTPNFHALNSVLQIDLFGQVSAETAGGRMAASPGGLPDFMRGAQDSDGGKSIVAVRAATPGKSDGIVARLEPPAIATGSAVDGHIFVSEFGVADVRGLSIDARAAAIIAIAAPEKRDGLAAEWGTCRTQLFGRGTPPTLGVR